MAKKTDKKKQSRQSTTRKTTQNKATKQQQQSQNKAAVLFFALGILLGFLVFIKGDGIWLKLHSFIFGMLGWSVYFVAPFCIYFAVMLTQGKAIDFIKRKAIQASVLMALISGAIEIFGDLPDETGLARIIKKLYIEGSEGKGGGALAILTAGPLSFIGSSPIPEIIIVLAIFVFLMLVTGSSLITLYHAIRTPVNSIEAAYIDHKENRQLQIAQQQEISEKINEVRADKLKWKEAEEIPEKTKTEEIKKEDHKFDIDIDISGDKTPEELEKIVPLETVAHDLKDISLNDPNVRLQNIAKAEKEEKPEKDDTRELKDVRDILSDWGLDSPVEYISANNVREVTESTIELETRPHPLEADIEEAREEDVLKVVQAYLDSIKTNDDQDIESVQKVGNHYFDEEIEVETFKADFSNETDYIPQSTVSPLQPLGSFQTVDPIDLDSAAQFLNTPSEVIIDPDNLTPMVNILEPVTQHLAESTVITPPKLVEISQPDNDNPWDDVVARVNQSVMEPKTDNIQPKSKIEEAVHIDDSYRLPPVDLLEAIQAPQKEDISQELKDNAEKLVSTLESFGVKTKIIDIARGPSVTRYELQPSPGVKISRITGLADDIALNLAAAGIRIEAPIPNKAAVGIEVPNKIVSLVRIREIIESQPFDQSKADIAMALGKDITGNQIVADISKMPHMLIAGATGSGKSVCINSIIMSILYKYSPDEVKLLMVDPKVVELGGYNGIPHLLVPVVTDPKKAAGALSWAVVEMLKRYKMFAEQGVRDINGYNKLVEENDEIQYMPKVVIIIDELADLMMASPAEVEDSICRLAQMARAAGMHLVIATQRPSVDVITGVIKANVPSRIAFAVSSQIDSRTILDMGGAEKLLGRGDMLFYPVGAAKPMRVQGCFVTDKEVERVVAQVKKGVRAEYDEEIVEEIERLAVAEKSSGGSSSNGMNDEDEMIPYAMEVIVEAGQGSTSLLQRRLKLGYARAARIIDQLEDRGIVGPFEGSKPRQLMITKEQYLEMKLAGLDQPNAGRGSAGELEASLF